MQRIQGKHPEHSTQLELGIWPGPCAHCGSSESEHSFNYCSNCSAIWCTKCTQTEATTRLEEKKKRDLYDKVIKATTDEPKPYHILSPDGLNMEEVHVAEVGRMRNEDKLEWLRLELQGDSAPLDDFAEKFKELFEKMILVKEQRRLCLELYRTYACIEEANITGEYETVEEYRKKAYSNGVNIPAHEIQGFERVWDPDAPARCIGCKATLPKECSNARCTNCTEATKTNFKTTCKQARGSQEEECRGDVIKINGCFVCKKCGHGAHYAAQHPEPDSVYATAPCYKGYNDALCMMQNFLEFENEVVDDESVTRKRKRL